jgi:hypothetical protein
MGAWKAQHTIHGTARTWVPQVRGPREWVFVRGVEVSILRPGKAKLFPNRSPALYGFSTFSGAFTTGVSAGASGSPKM